jgi:hypothetical protein
MTTQMERQRATHSFGLGDSVSRLVTLLHRFQNNPVVDLPRTLDPLSSKMKSLGRGGMWWQSIETFYRQFSATYGTSSAMPTGTFSNPSSASSWASGFSSLASKWRLGLCIHGSALLWHQYVSYQAPHTLSQCVRHLKRAMQTLRSS